MFLWINTPAPPSHFQLTSECALLQTCHVISVAHTGAKIWGNWDLYQNCCQNQDNFVMSTTSQLAILIFIQMILRFFFAVFRLFMAPYKHEYDIQYSTWNGWFTNSCKHWDVESPVKTMKLLPIIWLAGHHPSPVVILIIDIVDIIDSKTYAQKLMEISFFQCKCLPQLSWLICLQ